MENRIKMILGKKREEMQKERHEHDMNQHEVYIGDPLKHVMKHKNLFKKKGTHAMLNYIFYFYFIVPTSLVLLGRDMPPSSASTLSPFLFYMCVSDFCAAHVWMCSYVTMPGIMSKTITQEIF